jgi:hypothetical protein
MAVSKQDLRDFARFADEKLENGGVGSLVELAREWEAQRPQEAGTSLSRLNIDAGTLKLLAEAFPDIDDEQQLQQALARDSGITTAELLSKVASAAKKASQG